MYFWTTTVSLKGARAQYSCGIANFAIFRNFLFFPQFPETVNIFHNFYNFLQLSKSDS